MKLYFHAAHEGWVVDKFFSEWKEHNQDIHTDNLDEADTIWLCADWAWDQIPYYVYKNKRVITTCHHFVDWELEKYEYMIHVDSFTHEYHVPCERTKQQLQEYFNITKPIHVRSFWADPKKFYYIGDENKKQSKINLKATEQIYSLKRKFGFSEHDYIIGSFQRDTQGVGIAKGIYEPKSEKGADVFVEFLKLLRNKQNFKVLLGAWRRQYVMKEFDKLGIEYKYIELPPVNILNEMYNICDLIPICSRAEGHPMQIVESLLTYTNCISTNVGVAREFLHPDSISKVEKPYLASKEELTQSLLDVAVATCGFQNKEQEKQYTIPHAFEWFRKTLFGLS